MSKLKVYIAHLKFQGCLYEGLSEFTSYLLSELFAAYLCYLYSLNEMSLKCLL